MTRRPCGGQMRQAPRQAMAKRSMAPAVPSPPQQSVTSAIAELRKSLVLAKSQHSGHRLTYLRQFFRRKEFIDTPGLLGDFCSSWSPFPASRIYFAPSISNNDAALPVQRGALYTGFKSPRRMPNTKHMHAAKFAERSRSV